jgi:hypothetical protein
MDKKRQEAIVYNRQITKVLWAKSPGGQRVRFMLEARSPVPCPQRRAHAAVLNEGDWNPALWAGRACQCVCE